MLLLKREPNLEARHQAFLYQLQAVDAVKNREYAALFHEQGLGKTKIGIDLALTWIKEGVVDSVIIVTKKSLVRNWSEEIKTHTFFEARLLAQNPAANFHAFNSPARLYLAHYEVLKSEERRLALFQKTRRVGIILDEAHKIKNPDAEVTQTLLRLSKGFARRIIMTGTPVANRPYDIWAQIYFLDHGTALGTSFADFRTDLDLTNSLADDDDQRDRFESALTKVFEKIQAFTVRETKGTAGIDLPEKRIENIPVTLEAVQRKLYDTFRDELGAEIIRDGELVHDDAEEILKRLLRLVQVASNPRLIDDSYTGEPGKLQPTRDLVAKALAEDTKTIIWTSFIESARWLGEQFSGEGAVVVHGQRAITERNAAIQRFKTDPLCKVLVATPGAAKEGLTLTMASHAVFYDRSFSLDDYLQSQDRIHRISQKRTCFIWNLIATDSVDEWVDMLLAAKHLAAQLAQGDIDNEQYRKRASYEFGHLIRAILASVSQSG